MELVSVSCNSCGAPLKVGTQVRFVTCQFCASQLEIKRNESSIFTEQIDRIAENTTRMAQDLEAIKLQNEIEMLDREAVANSNPPRGTRSSRSLAGSVFGLLFAVFFCIVCFAMAGRAAKAGAPGLFALIPIGMGIFVLVGAVVAVVKSSDFSGRQDDLRRRREDLRRRLAEIRDQQKS